MNIFWIHFKIVLVSISRTVFVTLSMHYIFSSDHTLQGSMAEVRAEILNVEFLIDEYREREYLWNRNHPSFRNVPLRSAALTQIARLLKVESELSFDSCFNLYQSI